jgi:class 3 adenylate cyclase
MAVFNFPIKRDDHAANAVRAARAIQAACGEKFAEFARTHGLEKRELGVGIGIDSGTMKFGEFGHSHRDLTAIGTVVNTAARAQSAAAPGQILATRSVRERAHSQPWNNEPAEYRLKGFDAPILLYTT